MKIIFEIESMGKKGKLDEAIKAVKIMEEKYDVAPQTSTYGHLIKFCGTDVEKAKSLYQEMKSSISFLLISHW